MDVRVNRISLLNFPLFLQYFLLNSKGNMFVTTVIRLHNNC
jgi:hypothetical protein